MIPETIAHFLNASRIYLGLRSEPANGRRGNGLRSWYAGRPRPLPGTYQFRPKEVNRHEFPT